MASRRDDLQTIRSEGGLLPPDLLRRVIDPKANLKGTSPEDYGLPQGERLNEVITQSWSRLRKHWMEFRSAAERLPENEPGTGLTNDKWSLPLLRELGFGLLPTTPGPEIAGRTYAINRFFGPMPVHLVGCGLSLDRRAAGVRGAAAANPHGLVQEFINRSSGHLWAVVSNGLRLRILRDNQALSRQSFLEFDLEAMFAGEAYSDFVLLWLTAHATRFAPREGDRPESCWLEQWTKIAEEQGTRALGDLRGGVEKALQILGEGFTGHPKNTELRDGLRMGQLSLADFHGQLLRIVYRLIFLFVAEDRTLDGQPLLHSHDDSDSAGTARERFANHYSTARLRGLASTIAGSRHPDLWRQFRLLTGALSGDEAFSSAREHLALPTLGSFLWHLTSTVSLNEAELTNHDFLEALRYLAFTRQGKVLRPVDYKNLGAEELGGVYESLLALTPQVSADGARFTFAEFAGNERKTSGSYYTPDSLVQSLLDSALNPVVADAIKGKSGAEAERAILSLKVCDPAVGSGHFLVGAAHRLARHLSRVRAQTQGESEASPLLYQHALRDVIGRCLYGVDVNPMAAELCRVSLWLEALEPGKPLSFLDHHIRIGNSLLGATPELIAAGIPDDAFSAIEGDDKKACAALKKRNRTERQGLGPLFSEQEAETQARLQQTAAALEELPDDRPEDIRVKELALLRHEQTEEYRHKKRLADAWCAAFVVKKIFAEPGRESSVSGITQGTLNDLAVGRPVNPGRIADIERLATQYQFLHWHLAFPEVFAKAGFDCVLGNPPWDKVQPEATKFFEYARPDIASATTGAERDRLLEQVSSDDPGLLERWHDYQRSIEGLSHLLKHSGLLTASVGGNINLYRVFFELATVILNGRGRVGMVVQSGLVTDQSASPLLVSLMSAGRLLRVLDFENREGFFQDVHAQFRFALATAVGRQLGVPGGRVLFGMLLRSIAEADIPGRVIGLSLDDLRRLSPEAPTVPVFRSAREFQVTCSMYDAGARLGEAQSGFERVKVLGEFFNMNRDSKLFCGPTTKNAVRVFEAKCLHQFDHRFASFSGEDYEEVSLRQKVSPDVVAKTRHHVSPSDLSARRCRTGISGDWMVGWRDVASATNERTSIAAIIPACGVAHNTNLLHSLPAISACCIAANWNSFCFDFLARQKVSGAHVTIMVVSQLPVVPMHTWEAPAKWDGGTSAASWLLPRVLEMTYTAWDLEAFARDCGWSGPPFLWDEHRRFLLRCELDAALMSLYLPADKNGDWLINEAGESNEQLTLRKANFAKPRDAAAYIMDAFPIVRRKDEENYGGDYRTKRVILDIYDAIQESIRTGVPYQTRLDPPPADPACRHPKKALGILAFGSLITDPGPELEPKIAMRITTTTDFPVEYGRYSGTTRGGAPTLVPHEAGAPVRGEILVLSDTVTVAEATDMLWRRERRKSGSGETYTEGTSANSVLVRQSGDSTCVRNVLFTDFHTTGKIDKPNSQELAARSIESVRTAEDGKDGISYLMNNIAAGIETPLTEAYKAEILRQTNTESLEAALLQVKSARR